MRTGLSNANISKFETLTGKPKLIFVCNVCGFTGKTSGFPTSCPKCHFDPIAEVNKEREQYEEAIKA